MATEVLYHGRKPTEWRYFHCINCGTVWRDDFDGDGALRVMMPCPVCNIGCSDIPKNDALGYIPSGQCIFN